MTNIFSPSGLAVFLAYEKAADPGKFTDHPPRVTVEVLDRRLRVRLPDLRCSECGDGLRPPTDAPARWLAWNKLLNGGRTRCFDCWPADRAGGRTPQDGRGIEVSACEGVAKR